MSAFSNDGGTMSAVKLALLAQQVREQLDVDDLLSSEPIAIIGMGCRFPGGAGSPEAYWQLVRAGVDAIGTVPADRWDKDELYDPDPFTPGKMNTRRGGFVDGLDQFDASYFGISPREASHMDPQQRLVLEVAIEALERAGQPAERLAGSLTGVFVASSLHDYGDRYAGRPADIDAHSLSGNLQCIIANRLSFLLDLRGPSLALDTACSSSLVAVHMACQSLRSRDSDMALAAGVNVLLSPEPTVALSKWGLMAPDGACKTFDARADGFVRSEGCGVVVLKRLSDALAANDPVLAVIRGSAVNQDGRSTAMSAPNGLAQQDVLRRALRNGRVQPEQIGCVEAHGTGTALGDPIEVEALAAVIGVPAAGAPPVALTAVKSNIGHLEAAAGLAGLIKIVLCLQHEEIAPTIHYTELNPHISLDGTRLFIPTAVEPWPAGATARFAGISSFGFGGTNAHVVVEEAPRLPSAPPPEAPYILPLSAQSSDALEHVATELADHLSILDEQAVGNVCFTAAVRRTHHDTRLTIVGDTRDQLVERLRLFASGDRSSGIANGRRDPGARRRVAFVFSGQGPQWWAMGRELLETSHVFRETVERCDSLLGEHVGWSLLAELSADESDSRLDQTEIAQPALFALQVGLAAIWRSWGVTPDAVVGHSVGEVAAAHVSGALTLEDAIRVVALRGRLMQAATGNGAMASVERSAADVEAAIAGHAGEVGIAAINAPNATVISGTTAAVAEIVEALRASGSNVRPLPVNYAFHSPQMEGHARDLGAALDGLQPLRNHVRFVSSVTGAAVEGTELGHDYWARNVREPVSFAAAVETLASFGCDVFLELGPHPVLGGAMSETLGSVGAKAVITTSLRRGRPELETMQTALAALYCCGVGIDWSKVMPGRHNVVDLPTYPWQRQRHWFEPVERRSADHPHGGRAGHPLLGRRIRSAAIDGALFESQISAASPPFLDDHRIGDLAVVPATAFIELGAAAFAEATGCDSSQLESIEIMAALVLRSDGGPTNVQVHLQGDADGATFRISSEHNGGQWLVHAVGSARAFAKEPLTESVELEPIRERSPRETGGSTLYDELAGHNARFGPSFRGVETVWTGSAEALSRIVMPSVLGNEVQKYGFHPALLDATIHSIGTLFPESSGTYLPIALGEFRQHQLAAERMWSHLRVRADKSTATMFVDVTIVGDDGAVIAELLGLRMLRTTVDAVAALAHLGAGKNAASDLLFELAWRDAPIGSPPSPAGPWLIVEDAVGVGARTAALLGAAGARCSILHASEDLTVTSLREAVRARGVLDVVYLRGLDVPPLDTTEGIINDQRRSLGGALAVVQALSGETARLWLVTQGAQAVGGVASAPQQATLSGLGASISVEHPEIDCTRVDLDPAHGVERAAESLIAAIAATGGDELVAIRGDDRFVARLVPIASRVDAHRPVQLTSSAPGILDNLHLVPFTRRDPAADEVEIRVHCTGLNFRDVLIALGLYPEPVSTFGEECSGVVTRVGADVSGFRVGDRVIAMGSGSFATYLTTNAHLVIGVPDEIDFDAAATIPIAFLTAHHALVQLGRLRPGDHVLIHAAAGGVGMAAVQLAQQIGATVYATAGSPEKRSLLETIGVRHVFDSRSLDFADGVRTATEGRGVDVVLNSLNGDFIQATLDVLAVDGRFLEIGRRDIWTPQEVMAVRPDADYHVVFLGDLAVHVPSSISSMLAELMPLFSNGSLTPLPITTFDLPDVVEAFRYMAQARHVGKIVVRHTAVDPEVRVRADGTYLLTGGLGGIAIVLARWLVDRGARHVVLMSRRAVDDETSKLIDGLREGGAAVTVVRADVSRRHDVARVLDDIAASMPPLCGVVHAAGVNDDAVLDHLDWDQFESVLAPKLAGTWHLLDLTRDLQLDMFVLMSAASTVVGGPGQANYAAANSVLDALATSRPPAAGRALSIGWGVWDQVGMTLRLDERDRGRMSRRGLLPMSVEGALQAFVDAVGSRAVGGNAHLLAIAVDVPRLDDRPVFSELRATSTATARSEPISDVWQEWVVAVPGMRRSMISTFLLNQARRVLGLSTTAVIDPRQPFNELGLDSLMAVELRNAIGGALGRPQPATLLFDHPTAGSLVDHFVDLVASAAAAKTDGTSDAPSVMTARSSSERFEDDDLADLTEEQAEALLLAELGLTEADR